MSAVLMTISLAGVVGGASLVVDVGNLYYQYLRMQQASDAAALAGSAYLPGQPQKAQATARNYALNNGIQNSEIQSTTVSLDMRTIAVKIERTVPASLARVLGLQQFTVDANSQASVQPVNKNVKGALSLALDTSTPYTNGSPITLHDGGGACGSGNIVQLATSSSCQKEDDEDEDIDKEEHEADDDRAEHDNADADDHDKKAHQEMEDSEHKEHEQECEHDDEDGIEHGMSSKVSAGDQLRVMPAKQSATTKGVQARIDKGKSDHPSDTDDDYETDDARVVTVPLVQWNCANPHDSGTVKGFAEVFLDDVEGPDIHAHFIRQVVSGETSSGASECGVYHAALTH